MSANPLIKTIEIKDRTGRVVGTKDVVTYPGLLSKAHEEGLTEIQTSLVQVPTEANGMVAIAKAVVVTEKGHFEGIGDADPGNVTSFVVPHIIRMSETRAKARALRDAVNIGIVSFEELEGDADLATEPASAEPPARPASVTPIRRTRISGASAANGDGHRPGAPPRRSGPAADLMSEAQRRYLFRLLAGQGLDAEAAHEHLLEQFRVDSLGKVTKAAATRLIDAILGNGDEAAAHAHAEQ